MALTKLTDIRKSLSVEVEDLQVNGITTFTGSVSIGGTLTYEDVTNIDSVGVITARSGVNVSGGQLDVGSNIKIGNAGIITATRIVSTIGTFTGDTAISGSLQIADTIQHEGDVNTKIRFPAADTFSVETAGSERVRIDAAGDIFVGTTSDIAPANGTNLCVSDSTISRIILEKQSTIKFGLNVSDAFQIYDETNNASRLSIDSTGKLGLGMTPDTWHTNNQKVFQISGTNAGSNIFTRAGSAHLSSNFIYNSSDAGVFQAASGYAMHHAVSATNGTFDWQSSSAASSSAGSAATMVTRLRIDASGRLIVGSGSHSGGTQVVIKGGGVNTYSTLGMYSNHTNPSSGTLLSQIRFGSNATADGADIRMYADGDWGTNDYPSRIGFYTAPDGSNSRHEQFRIDSAGRIFTGGDTQVLNTERGSLHISGGGTSGSRVSIRGTATGAGNGLAEVFAFWDTNKVAGMIAFAGDDTTNKDEGKLNFYTANGSGVQARLKISKEGYVTKPNQPIASLSHSSAVDLNSAVLTSSNFYSQTWVNQGNHFNASNGRFVCPIAGVYRIYFRATIDQTGHTNVRLRRNGSTVNEAYANHTSGTTSSDSSEAVVNCSANDYLEIEASRLKAIGGTQHKQVTFELMS